MGIDRDAVATMITVAKRKMADARRRSEYYF